jgi:hypothetical protein
MAAEEGSVYPLSKMSFFLCKRAHDGSTSTSASSHSCPCDKDDKTHAVLAVRRSSSGSIGKVHGGIMILIGDPSRVGFARDVNLGERAVSRGEGDRGHQGEERDELARGHGHVVDEQSNGKRRSRGSYQSLMDVRGEKMLDRNVAAGAKEGRGRNPLALYTQL